MSKTKIKITESDNNIILYGITSQLNDYKISWLLNTELNINLKKTDHFLASKKGIEEDLIFSVYEYCNDNLKLELISNKTDTGIRLINLPTIDFILKIYLITNNNLINIIKNIKGIIAITGLKDNPKIQKKIQKEILDLLK